MYGLNTVGIKSNVCYYVVIMKTIRVSATKARNTFFTLLNQVLYKDVRVVIEKSGVEKEALLVSKEPREREIKERIELIEKTYGMLKDVPKSKFLDDRLRGKKAKKFLDKVRKGDV